MTEKELRAKLVSTAQKYLGCKESDGSHKKIIDLYNGGKPPNYYKMTYSDAWCACFGSAVAMEAGLTDIIPIEVSCNRQIELFKKLGSWQESDAYVPSPGDYIFYDWQDSGAGDNTGSADHVGIVVSCDGKTIKVIEGNMSDAVGYRNIAVNGKFIRGFGVPKYGSKASTPTGGTVSAMKYSESNKPLVCMQTQSTCYRGTRKMTVKGVLWHSTGANNPNLKRYVQPSDNAADKEAMLKLLGKNQYGNDWNHIERQAGLNCWIGKLADGTVATVQTMPWDYRPWGCGSGSKGSCNDGWIQFEICEDALTDKTYFEKVYKEACEITAYLCKMFGINPKGTVQHNGVTVPTILCHHDSYKYGLGGNHGDVDHWFPKFGKSMETARDDVAKLLAGGSAAAVTPAPAPAPVQTAVGSYLVRITATDLNIRTGPGTDNPSKGYIKPGTYTIVAESAGKGATKWGKLKSGAGWVALDYCKKV